MVLSTLSVVLLLLLPSASASATEGELFTTAATSLTGRYTMGANDAALWLRTENDPAAAYGFANFEFEAPSVTVRAFRYQGYQEVYVFDELLAESPTDPSQEPTEATYTNVHLTLDALYPAGQLRLLASAQTDVEVENLGAVIIHPNGAESLDWREGYTTPVPLFHDELRKYNEVSPGRFVYEMSASRSIASGPMSFFIHGADLTLVSAEGRQALDGMPQRTEYDAGVASAQSTEWTDYEFIVWTSSRLDMEWRARTDFIAPASRLEGQGALDVAAATGSLLVDGHELVLNAEPARIDGEVRADLQSLVRDGAPAIEFRFVPSAATTTASKPSALASLGLGWLLLGGALALGLPGGFLAGRAVFARRRGLSDRRPIDALAGGLDEGLRHLQKGLQLANEGRIDKALPHLEKGIGAGADVPDARYALGVALARAGRVADGLQHVEYAIRRDPLFLGLFVSDPETAAFRHRPEAEAFVRRAARRFHDTDRKGYA